MQLGTDKLFHGTMNNVESHIVDLPRLVQVGEGIPTVDEVPEKIPERSMVSSGNLQNKITSNDMPSS